MELGRPEKFLIIYIPLTIILILIGRYILISTRIICSPCYSCGCELNDIAYPLLGVTILIFTIIGVVVYQYLKKKKID